MNSSNMSNPYPYGPDQRRKIILKAALNLYETLLRQANIVRSDAERASDIHKIHELVEKIVLRSLPLQSLREHIQKLVNEIIKEESIKKKEEERARRRRMEGGRRIKEMGRRREEEEEEGYEQERRYYPGKPSIEDLERLRRATRATEEEEEGGRWSRSIRMGEMVVEVTPENLEDIIDLYMDASAYVVHIYIKDQERDILYDDFTVTFKYARKILPDLLNKWRGRARIYMSKER